MLIKRAHVHIFFLLSFSPRGRCASIEGSRQFRGDGYLIFTPDAKPIVLPWSASFAFRTRQTDSFLMKIEMDPGHSVLVEVTTEKIVIIIGNLGLCVRCIRPNKEQTVYYVTHCI